MKRIIATLVFLGSINVVLSQTLFQRTFGTSGDETGIRILETSDKGFLSMGYFIAYSDFYLIKTDSVGNKLWSKVYHLGPYVNDIIEISGGSIVICGETTDSGGFPVGFLLELDALGNLTWVKTYYLHVQRFSYVKKALDGSGYLVSGFGGVGSLDHPFILKTDLSGNVLWGHSVKLPTSSYAESPAMFLQSQADSCIYLASAYAAGGTNIKVQLSKYSSNGMGIWTKNITVSNLSNQTGLTPYFMRNAHNKNILLGMSNNAFDIVELDTAGTPIKTINYHVTPYYWDLVNPLVDNSIYTIGGGIVSKMDSAGNIKWANALTDDGNSFAICKNGNGFAAITSTKSYSVGKNDVFIYRVDSTGAVGCHPVTQYTGTPTYPVATTINFPCPFDTMNAMVGGSSFYSYAPIDTTYDACGCVPPKAIFTTGYPNPNYGSIGDYSTWSTNWFWDFGNGTTSTNPSPSPNYTVNGTYTVCLKVSNSCGADSVCHPINYVFMGIGVENIKQMNDVKVFPNPVTDFVTIQSSSEIGAIVIYNTLGEKVKETRTKMQEASIDVSNLPWGVYTINAQGFYKKIIKE